MRILLDVRAGLSTGTGLGTYTVELARALRSLDVDLTLWLAARQANALVAQLDPALAALDAPLVTTRLSTAAVYSARALGLWRRWPQRLPAPELLPQGHDVFHSPHWPVPLTRRTPLVLTIHDLFGLHYPQWVPPYVVAVHRAVAALAPRAARVVCDSQAVRRDVIERCALAPERVDVVPLAVADRFRAPHDPAAVADVRRRHGLDRPYVLGVGTREPRRNLARLVAAYDTLDAAPDVDLVLAGADSATGDTDLESALARPRAGRVKALGYVPKADLPLLYAGAAVTACVSLAEGFGLPPLEAMAAGCPMVCSSAWSLPEVVGEAGLVIDPLHVDAIADALARVLADEALAADLRRRGQARAAEFTWRRTAEQTLASYRAALR